MYLPKLTLFCLDSKFDDNGFLHTGQIEDKVEERFKRNWTWLRRVVKELYGWRVDSVSRRNLERAMRQLEAKPGGVPYTGAADSSTGALANSYVWEKYGARSRAGLQAIANLVRCKDGEKQVSLPEDCMATELDPFIHCTRSDQLPGKIVESRSKWYSPDSSLLGFRNSRSTAKEQSHVLTIGEVNTHIWKFRRKTVMARLKGERPPDYPEDKHDQLWWLKRPKGHLPVTDSPASDVIMHSVQLCENVSYLTDNLSKETWKHWLSANTYFIGRRSPVICTISFRTAAMIAAVGG